MTHPHKRDLSSAGSWSTESHRANTLIYVHIVKRGLDRAFAAAERVQARHEDVTIELWLSDPDPKYAVGLDNLPQVDFLVEVPGASEPYGLGPFRVDLMKTRHTMIALLESAVVEVRDCLSKSATP